MAPVFFLTQQAALPSRKVLRKVIQFATALAQPIVVLVEESRAVIGSSWSLTARLHVPRSRLVSAAV